MLPALTIAEPAVSDDVLADRARRGSTQAFAELVSRYQQRIYRVAIRMSRSPSDAEEITQETFLLAHRAIGTFHGDARFSTWLYRIAVNQALMVRRSAWRRPSQSLEDLGRGEAILASGAEPPEGADELLYWKNLLKRLQDALPRLDDAHRAALVLRDIEQLSAEQAGEILGVSADVIRQRAHRARLKLREQLLGPISKPRPLRGNARERATRE
jgi:RNA polymerase sigma-70 factor (ECF subfamily)